MDRRYQVHASRPRGGVRRQRQTFGMRQAANADLNRHTAIMPWALNIPQPGGIENNATG
jgi:hypothetical protein